MDVCVCLTPSIRPMRSSSASSCSRFAAQEDQVVVGAADRGYFLDLGHALQLADHGGGRLGQHADEAVGSHRGFFEQAAQPHAVSRDHMLAFQPRDACHHGGAASPSLRARIAAGSRALACSRLSSCRSMASSRSFMRGNVAGGRPVPGGVTNLQGGPARVNAPGAAAIPIVRARPGGPRRATLPRPARFSHPTPAGCRPGRCDRRIRSG